ncbi:MAG: NYN domain-containing protein [Gemmatimonadota bacterium]
MNTQFTRAPHWRGDSAEESAPNAALLIDFDNVTMAMRSNLALELRKLLSSEIIRGKVAVQRAYADWRRYPQYIVPLSEASIDLIFAPAYGSSKKNATDIRLAVDALEIVFTRPEIGTYILLSGDSDFSSLVLKLKEYGKYVIGVGLQESSSDILVQNCDEYYSYNTLSGLTSATTMSRERYDPWELTERAVARMVKRGDVMRSDRLKQVMLELDPTFDEKTAGFSKFNRFLAEAASRRIVQLKKCENGQYEVRPAEGNGSEGAPADASARPRASRPRGRKGEPRRESPGEVPVEGAGRGGAPVKGSRRGASPLREEAPESSGPAVEEGSGVRASSAADAPAEALRRAYALLVTAVHDLRSGGQAVRDSEVKRKMLAEEPSFDEAALGFRKFSRFLQQAHDEGVVDVKQEEDGNYYISPSKEPVASGVARPSGGGRKQPRDRGRRERGGGRSAAPRTPARDRPEAQAEPFERPRTRGLGRFRRGSRGGGAGERAGAGEPSRLAGSAAASAEAAGAPSKERRPTEGDRPAAGGTREGRSAEEALQHMVNHYPGVGRRTASRLVQAFGDRVFEVIDREPDRITQVLSSRRARAVIEARRAEAET